MSTRACALPAPPQSGDDPEEPLPGRQWTTRGPARQWAAAIAREDLATLGRVAGPMWSEVLFRVAAAEAFFAAGAREDARTTLLGALTEIERRAAALSDTALKDGYLDGRPENPRARKLASAWLAPPMLQL